MRIAILSNGNTNYSTLRLKEEAEKRGHQVKVVKYKNCYVSIDEKHPTVIYKGKEIGEFDVVIPRIASHMTKYGTAVLRQLEMMYPKAFFMNRSIAITRARDKLRSTQLLVKAGVSIPKTVFSRNATDIDSLIEEIGGMPAIIKLARGTHGNGVVLAETKKAAKSVLQAFYLTNSDGTNVLLQEFIKESAGTDIRAFVVGSQVVASMKRQSLDDDFRSNLHNSVKLTDAERKMCIKAAKAMGLTVAGVDFMRSSRGALVLEVNASPGFGIEKITRRNVSGKIIDYIERNAKRGNKKDKIGA